MKPPILRRLVPAVLVAVLLLTGACNTNVDPNDPDLMTARLDFPEEHPEGPGERPFTASVRAYRSDAGLVIEGRQGDEVIQLVLGGFDGHEFVTEMGSTTNYGAYGRVDRSCTAVGIDEDPPCRLTHHSQFNYGYANIYKVREDFVAASFSFRALDRDDPSTAFNVREGEVTVHY